jgi:branched-chain amino acid transport system substrate-binding protein
MKIRNCIARAAGLLLAGLVAVSANAEQGVSESKIVFGQVAPLEGSVGALGNGARTGLLAAFNEANAKGGIGGRRIELISRNDGYEPERSIALTRQMIEEDHIFALVATVGTSPSLAAEPIAAEAGVPFVGPLTGTESLRHATKSGVVNLRPSYSEEAEFVVEHLIKDYGITRIGVFYQNDSFGRAGFASYVQVPAKRGMTPAAEGVFESNTLAIKVALAMIRKANPQGVVMIAPYAPSVEFVKLAHQLNFEPLFVANSLTGLAIVQQLGSAANGIFFPEMVPTAGEPVIPAVTHYRAAMAALDPNTNANDIGFEGYLVGRLIIAALRNAGDAPTRRSFLEAIFGHKFDIDGVVLDFPLHKNQATPQLSLMVIGPDGKAKTVAAINRPAK